MLSLSLSSPLVLKSESWHCHRPAEHAWSCSLQDACEGWWVKQQLGRANTKVDARIRASSLPGSRQSGLLEEIRVLTSLAFTDLPGTPASPVYWKDHSWHRKQLWQTQSKFTWTQRERERDQQLIKEIDWQYYYIFPYYSFGSNICILSDRHTCLCQLATVVHNYVPNG